MASLRSLIVRIGADSTDIDKAMQRIGAQAKDVQQIVQQFGNTDIGNGTLNQSLQRVSDNIGRIIQSQQRLANDAQNVARGIAAIGGPAKLTSDQLDQMARSIDKGLDAFRALGQEAPAELQKISVAVKAQQEALRALTNPPQVGPSSNPLSGFLVGFAGGVIGGGLSTAALRITQDLFNLSTAALTAGDSLTRLEDRTGIGAGALQRLQAIAQPSGNSLDEIAVAVNRFQRNLVEGNQPALAALRALGISFSEIRQLSPDEQFIAIAKAIQQIHDPAQQTALAMELFGRGGAEVLPTLKAKVDELAGSTHQMSVETVHLLDEFGDSLGRLKTSAIADFGEMIAEAIRAAQRIRDLFPQNQPPPNETRDQRIQRQAQERLSTALANGPAAFAAELEAQNPTPLPLSPKVPGFFLPPTGQTLFGQTPQQTTGIDRATAALRAQQATAEALGLSLEDYRKNLDAANQHAAQLAQGVSGLTQAQKLQILAGDALGLSIEEISVRLGINHTAIKLYLDSMQHTVETMQANTEATGKFQQEFGKLTFGYNAAGIVVQGFTGLLHQQVGELGILGGSLKQIEEQLQRLGRFSSATFLEQQGGALSPARFDLANPALVSLSSVQLNGLGQLPNVVAQGTDQIRLAENETVKWKDELSGLSGAFSRLAQVSDGVFKGIVQDIAAVIGALDVTGKGLEQFRESLEHTDKEGNTVATNPIGLAAGLAGAGAGFLTATGAKNPLLAALGGAASGGQIGGQLGFAIGGPLGAAIGEGIGATAGFITGLARALHQTEAQKLAHDVGRDLGVQISDGLAEQLEKDSLEFGRQITESLHLDQIIGEAGGIDTFGIDRAISKTRDLFVFLGQGRITAQQFADEFDKVFAEELPAAVDKFTGLAKQSFAELIGLARQFGTETEQVQQFITGQVNDQILGGLNTFLTASATANSKQLQARIDILETRLASAEASGDTGRASDLQKQIDLLTAQQKAIDATRISSQETAEAISQTLFVAFQELVTSGKSITDALRAIEPQFDQLQKALANAGVSGGAAFDALKDFFDLLKDPAVGPAINAINGLGQTLSGLANIDRLSPTLFSGLTSQVGSIVDSLTASGKSQSDIIDLIQPTLQTIFELQERNGITLDPKTQQILQEAITEGKVGDQFKNAQERMVDQQVITNQILERIAQKQGVTLPPGLLPQPRPVPGTGTPTSPTPTGPSEPPQIATGGVILANGGVQRFAEGGRVLPFTQPAVARALASGEPRGQLMRFEPKGTDTVPALLTPGEIVLNARQQQLLATTLQSAGLALPGTSPVQLLSAVASGVALAPTSASGHVAPAPSATSSTVFGGDVTVDSMTVGAGSYVGPRFSASSVASTIAGDRVSSFAIGGAVYAPHTTFATSTVATPLSLTFAAAAPSTTVSGPVSLSTSQATSSVAGDVVSYFAAGGIVSPLSIAIGGRAVTDRPAVEHFSTGGAVGPVSYFATGGSVSTTLLNFAARGTDTVPAMLTPGEIVLTEVQQQHLVDLITQRLTVSPQFTLQLPGGAASVAAPAAQPTASFGPSSVLPRPPIPSATIPPPLIHALPVPPIGSGGSIGSPTGPVIQPPSVTIVLPPGTVLPFVSRTPSVTPHQAVPTSEAGGGSLNEIGSRLSTGGPLIHIERVEVGPVYSDNPESFKAQIPTISRMVREHVAQGGTEQTAWRQAVGGRRS